MGKCRRTDDIEFIYNTLLKSGNAGPGRAEIPHRGDDEVIGGWTFSHFLMNNGEMQKDG